MNGPLRPPVWASEGSCTEVDGDLWFPEAGRVAREAKAICGQCPVQKLCLDYALDNTITIGVWGGLSAKERERVLRDRRTVEVTVEVAA